MRVVPVELQMLGDDRQRLKRAAGGGGVHGEFRARTEEVAQRAAHLFRLRETGAGKGGVRRIALQPARGVEDGFAMPGDEIAAAAFVRIGRHVPVIKRGDGERNGFRMCDPHRVEPVGGKQTETQPFTRRGLREFNRRYRACKGARARGIHPAKFKPCGAKTTENLVYLRFMQRAGGSLIWPLPADLGRRKNVDGVFYA